MTPGDKVRLAAYHETARMETASGHGTMAVVHNNSSHYLVVYCADQPYWTSPYDMEGILTASIDYSQANEETLKFLHLQALNAAVMEAMTR